MADGPEGARKRNLNHLASQAPEQALVVAIIVKHLGSEDAYTPLGSVERDFQAAAAGEFGKDFEDQTELPLDKYVKATAPINWDDLFDRELETVYA